MEISRELATTTSPTQLLRRIVEVTVRVTGTESASILLFDEPSDELRFITAVRSTDQLVTIPVPIDQSIAGACFATGQPVMVPDVSQDPHYYPEVELQTGFQVRSLLAVPLQYGECRIGVLEVANKGDDSAFTGHDVDILGTLAAQATVTIENARLVEALQQHRDHLEHLFISALGETEHPILHSCANRVIIYLSHGRRMGGKVRQRWTICLLTMSAPAATRRCW